MNTAAAPPPRPQQLPGHPPLNREPGVHGGPGDPSRCAQAPGAGRTGKLAAVASVAREGYHS
ncbi:hypothetical protein JCM10135_08660 [Stetteria hydrogenophila]